MAGPKRKAFVAYTSRDAAHADAVLEAVRRANAIDQPYDYHPWAFNDIPGEPLISPILENIDESAFVVADVTFLNLNVVYEVGYAIGRMKRVFLVRSMAVNGTRRSQLPPASSTRWATTLLTTLSGLRADLPPILRNVILIST